MFDIGFPELLIISIVALLVFGPERLPEVLRTVGGWIGSARRSFTTLKAELEKEVGADEIRRDLHNSRIMEEAKQLQRQVSASKDEVEELLGKRYAALQEDERRQQSGTGAAGDAGAPAAVTAPDRSSDADAPDPTDAADPAGDRPLRDASAGEDAGVMEHGARPEEDSDGDSKAGDAAPGAAGQPATKPPGDPDPRP